MTTIAPDRFFPTRSGLRGGLEAVPPPAFEELGSPPAYEQILIWNFSNCSGANPITVPRGFNSLIRGGGYAAHEANHLTYVAAAAAYGVPLGRFHQNPFGRDRKQILLPNGQPTSQRADQQARCELHGLAWIVQSYIDNIVPGRTLVYIGGIPIDALVKQEGYRYLLNLGCRLAVDALTGHDGTGPMYDQMKALYDLGFDILTEANGTASAGGSFGIPAVAFTGLGSITAGWAKADRVQPADAIAGSMWLWRRPDLDGVWDDVAFPALQGFMASAPVGERRAAVDYDSLEPAQRDELNAYFATLASTLDVVCSPGSAAFELGGAPVVIDPAIVIVTEQADCDEATVSVGAGYVEGDDLLEFDDTAEITGGFDAPTGVLTLTGPATREQFQDALRSVTYDNAGSPTEGSREITFEVDDGVATADDSRTVEISTPPDLSPVVDCTDAALGYTIDDDGAVAVDAGLVLSDPDSTDLVEATVTIGGYVAGEDVLVYGGAIASAWNADTGVLSMQALESVATWQAALRSITFEHTGTTPGARVITFEVGDGVQSGSDFRVIDVAFGDVPVITSVSPAAARRGTTVELTILGSGFVDGTVASASGDGITVNSTTYVDEGTLTWNITVHGDASSGARQVTVTRPDDLADTLVGGLVISDGGARTRQRNRRIR